MHAASFAANFVSFGERTVRLLAPNVECTIKEFHEILVQKYPKLIDAEGFELLRCVANTRLLEPILSSVAKLLKQVVGNGRIYIQPLQKHLDLAPVHDQSTSQEVRY